MLIARGVVDKPGEMVLGNVAVRPLVIPAADCQFLSVRVFDRSEIASFDITTFCSTEPTFPQGNGHD